MPRTRRAAAPEVTEVETTVADGAPAIAMDSLPETTSETAPVKPARRRTPRKKTELSTPDPAAAHPESSTPEIAAPVLPTETEPAEERSPDLTLASEGEPVAPRRRGRLAGRVKAPVAAAETPDPTLFDGMTSPANAIAEPIAEVPAETPKRERGGRRRGNTATPAEEIPTAEAPKRARGDRRRGNTATPAEEIAAALPVVEAAVTPPTDEPAETTEAPQPTRQGRAPRTRGDRRRKGQQVAQAETAEPANIAETVTLTSDAAAEEAAPQEETRPKPRQGSRRRHGRITEVEVTVDEAVTVEAEAAPDDQAADEEDSSRKSRRSRRNGRRRKGGDDVLPEEGDESELLVNMEESDEEPVDDDDLLLPLVAVTIPAYVAPPLVPDISALPHDAPLSRVSASVKKSHGHNLNRIVIDHRNYAPYFFFINAEAANDGDVVDAQLRQAASAGIHLYSGVMHLPLKNAYGDRSFGAIDAFVQQILDADPEAYILPRLQCVPTNYWLRTHPGETAVFAGVTDGDVSLASTEFWADCVDAIEALISHFADPRTAGGDRIIGFHLDRGEWFHDSTVGPDVSPPNRAAFQSWLQEKYQLPYALRAAWYDGSVTFETADIPTWQGKTVPMKRGDSPIYLTAREGRWVDYALFTSECTANIITGLARVVKSLSKGRLLVAVSYGYTLEFANRNDSGHLAMGKLLQSADIDIVAGPNTYTGRSAGNPASFGALVDSVKLHGKLWIVEDDTKTFLAQEETDDTYNPKIVSGSDTRAAHQRHFGAALAHGAGVNWMDLWGQGWLNSEDIWRELGGLQDLADRWSRNAPETSAAPEVVVLVDEASLAYVKNDPTGLNSNLISKTRDLLLRTGVSLGFYLQSDITHENFPDAKLYLFLNALRLTSNERQAIRERLQRRGKTLAWFYAPGLFDEDGPTAQESGDVVGMALRRQPWNSRQGSQMLEVRHPITERLRNGRRIGPEEILNPSIAVSDPQATVLSEYLSTGAPSLAVREHIDGWKSVFLGEPHLTVELLRGIFAYAGVSHFDVQDDVVYANNDGVLLIHAPFTGQRTIKLPQRATVYDALENRIVATDSTTFRSFLRARTTRLYFWGPSERIMELSGLELPSSQAIIEANIPEQAMADGDQFIPQEVHEDVEARRSRDADEFLANLPGMEILEPLAGADGAQEPPAMGDDDASPTPRSRWQRRRAAARARRDAERQAPAADGVAVQTESAPPPVDIATIMPNLPPRRRPTKPKPVDGNGTTA